MSCNSTMETFNDEHTQAGNAKKDYSLRMCGIQYFHYFYDTDLFHIDLLTVYYSVHMLRTCSNILSNAQYMFVNALDVLQSIFINLLL